MTVLIVQNFEKTAPGLVGEVLEDAGHEVHLVAAHDGGQIPESHTAYSAMVVLGGGQDALDDVGSPWLPQVLGLLRQFAEAEKPVLGICLGCQLLARALGGSNQIGGASEFAWSQIELTTHARADPVFARLPQTFPSFQWHDDTFTLPPGAVLLATGENVANQAFRHGRNAYGIQPHFEADRALVRQWNTDFAEYLLENHPGWLERHDGEAEFHGPRSDNAGRQIAEAWVALI